MRMLKRSNSDLTSGSKLNKRCSGHSTHRSRKHYKSRASSSSASATSTGDSTNTTKAVQVKAAVQKGDSSDKTSSSAKVFSTEAPKTTTTTSAKAESTSSSSSSSSDAGNYDGDDTSGKGLFGVSDDTCGDSGATETPTNDGGPNGKESWLNCGVSEGGWVS